MATTPSATYARNHWVEGRRGYGIQKGKFDSSLNIAVSSLEQLQQFGKPTWHPYNFGKTRKIGLQQFGKPTWQK
jgi:hypothetical protein